MTRPLTLLTTTLAAMSLAASPALADVRVSASGSAGGQNADASTTNGSLTGSFSGSLGNSLSATLTGSAGGPASTSAGSSTLTVTGPTVSAVTVYINGKKVQTATNASVDGSYTLTVNSKRLRRARSAKAVVHFDGGGTQTLSLSASAG